MKRIWVAVGFLALSLIFAFAEFLIVSKSYKNYVEQIQIAEYYISDKEFSVAQDICKNIEEEWEKSRKTLNVFMIHTYSENISESIAKLSEYAQNKDKKAFLSQSSKTKRQLLYIKQSELPNLENIM
ncbi:MAG: DUF4363 family protein [Ruminococcaceae bacterium]|nr:DUF4363 family protein [Oscillospiraceae bacterium]